MLSFPMLNHGNIFGSPLCFPGGVPAFYTNLQDIITMQCFKHKCYHFPIMHWRQSDHRERIKMFTAVANFSCYFNTSTNVFGCCQVYFPRNHKYKYKNWVCCQLRNTNTKHHVCCQLQLPRKGLKLEPRALQLEGLKVYEVRLDWYTIYEVRSIECDCCWSLTHHHSQWMLIVTHKEVPWKIRLILIFLFYRYFS